MAAGERCEVAVIARLLGDPSFQRPIRAYEELLEAPPVPERLALRALARDDSG